MPAIGRCKVVLGDKKEEVKEFKYLGIVLCRHGEIEGKIRECCERQMCHSVIGSLVRVMRKGGIH